MKKSKPSKFKSVKKALPLLALFGGQGMASNRANSVSLSSRKFAKKPIFFVDNSDKNSTNLPTLTANQAVKSPFSAFTNISTGKTCNAEIKNNQKALNFLKNNNLMTANSSTSSSQISGNTNSNKTLAHPLVFVTTNSKSYLCNANAGAHRFSYSQNQCGIYFKSNAPVAISGAIKNITISSTSFYASGTQAAIQNACQIMHNYCFHGKTTSGAGTVLLPVELEKFEVE